MVIAIAWRVMAIGFIHRALEQEKRLNCVEDHGQAHGIKIHKAVETRLNLPQTVECVSRLVSAIYDEYSEDVNRVLHGMDGSWLQRSLPTTDGSLRLPIF